MAIAVFNCCVYHSGDRRKLELADKFRDLKKSGKLNKYLAKKRKKNAQKEKRKLPGKNTVFT